MSIWDDVKNALPAINPGLWPAPFINSGDQPGGPRLGGLDAAGYEDIINRINAGAGQGTYGEGIIATGLQEFKSLQDQFRSGKLSGEEYSQIAGAILPTLKNAATTLGGGGSRSANALWAAGGSDLLSLIRDYDVMNFGKQALGRDLTVQEIDQFRPYFEGGDTEGRAALAEYARMEERSPEGLARKAPKYYDQSKNLISELLGREARQDELDYYGRQLASGVTPYELRGYIEQTPEYRTAADSKFRSGLASELEGYDQSFFGKAKEDVLSRYSRMGTQHSPALDFALTNLMGDIAKERGSYLAKVSADQYGGNKQAAREDYLGTMDRYVDDRRYDRGRSDMVSDRLYGRANELYDYGLQKRDYMDALNAGGGRRSNTGQMIGAGLGLAGSLYTKDPGWMGVGQGTGGIWDSLYNR